MKVQILRLDAEDDLASIQDRLAWIQAGRVILVWPGEGVRLPRRLDLLLLQRQAERRGARAGAGDPRSERFKITRVCSASLS